MPPSGQPWIIPQLASNDDKSRVLRFINVLHYYHGIDVSHFCYLAAVWCGMKILLVVTCKSLVVATQGLAVKIRG